MKTRDVLQFILGAVIAVMSPYMGTQLYEWLPHGTDALELGAGITAAVMLVGGLGIGISLCATAKVFD